MSDAEEGLEGIPHSIRRICGRLSNAGCESKIQTETNEFC